MGEAATAGATEGTAMTEEERNGVIGLLQLMWMVMFLLFLGRHGIRKHWGAVRRIAFYAARGFGLFLIFSAVLALIPVVVNYDWRGTMGLVTANVVIIGAMVSVLAVCAFMVLIIYREFQATRKQRRDGIEDDGSPYLNIGPREVATDLWAAFKEKTR